MSLIYKFGGASIQDVERFKNAAHIISQHQNQLLVVISAMGKTTNALEKIVEAYFNKENKLALDRFQVIKDEHLQFASSVLGWSAEKCEKLLLEVITEIEWLLHDQPVRSYDYYYDQIVCAGELMSTLIMHQYLLQQGIQADWLDVRDVLRTSDHFRDASIDWEVSTSQIHQTVHPILKNNIVITQGFIGATDGNESTTLGREGSDYSAAIFAHILDADSVTIWKDVVAVMSADPKKYPDAVAIPKLSYHEVIEMAYYGAQVIHPKTIKPLQNKNIPLYVKSFLDPNLPGTTIDGSTLQNLPPIIIEKKNQVLVNFQSKDFSFVEGKPAELLRNWMNQAFMKSNLSQHTAISLLCSLDDHPSKIEALALQASELFDVHLQKDLTLLTIRHYTEELIQERTNGKRIIVEQRTPDTVQFVLAD